MRITATPTEPLCGEDITFTYRGREVTHGTMTRTYTIDDSQVTLCWLDRNLGAAGVAESSADVQAYGDLFQWGRGDDGHQDRNSGTVTGTIDNDVPGHNQFITVGNEPYDWRSPQNNDLWQGVDGTNNPCPPNWRLPTEDELTLEKDDWASFGAEGAYNSSLKWPVAGWRLNDGDIYAENSWGYVWSSTSSTEYYSSVYYTAKTLIYSDEVENISSVKRALGLSVRCVRR